LENVSVAALIIRRMGELKLSHLDVVRRMGYVKLEKGKKHLQQILGDADLSEHQLAQLAKALDVNKAVLQTALLETQRQIKIMENEAREKAFRPYLCAMCENSRLDATQVARMTYSYSFVNFGLDYLQKPYSQQLVEAREKVLVHFEGLKGCIPVYGKIRYYILHRSFKEQLDSMLCFDTDGNILEHPEERFRNDPAEQSARYERQRRLRFLRYIFPLE
jgi:hypothetical protein